MFAARGLHGTPTMEIAKAAGISQAYLFRLFPTKAELFLALVERCNARVQQHVRRRGRGGARRRRAGARRRWGWPTSGLLGDRNLLLNQLNSLAACDDPAIRDQVRRGFAQLVELVERESGAGAEEVRDFFAQGMLLNVLVAMQAQDVDEHWAQVLLKPPPDLDCC